MSDWIKDINDALSNFIIVSQLAGVPITPQEFIVEYLEAPHKPPARLPQDKMAVYGFYYKKEGKWLKIGMAGPKSNARYTSQHYNPNSARSSLAKSLLHDQDIRSSENFNDMNISSWIKANCNRVNILMDSKYDSKLLALLEAFLHVRLRPRYER